MSVENALKNYDFALELGGILQAGLQGVTPPKVENAVHKQGNQGNRPDKKSPGKKMVGDMTIEQVVPLDTGDPQLWAWFASNETNIRAGYARPGFLVELNNGVPVNRFFLDSCWIISIESTVMDTRQDNSADILRTVVMSCDDYIQVPN